MSKFKVGDKVVFKMALFPGVFTVKEVIKAGLGDHIIYKLSGDFSKLWPAFGEKGARPREIFRSVFGFMLDHASAKDLGIS